MKGLIMSNLYAEIFSYQNTPNITESFLNQHLFQIENIILREIF